jgi:hypothetical protein
MTITPNEIRSLVEHELAILAEEKVVAHIRNLLVEPRVELRPWDYGSVGQSLPCWIVFRHTQSNTGIAYCEYGFGPKNPWGLLWLTGSISSIGMDSGWFGTFLDAYRDSMASFDPSEK